MIQQIEPAGAKAKEWDKLNPLFADPQWTIEPKLDGWRFLLHVGNKLPRVYLTGRHITKKTGTYSEKGECAPHLLPIGNTRRKMLDKFGYTVIDGEIMPPLGAGFRDLAGIMNVTPDKAHARIEEIGYPEYHAFDLLYYDGKDVRSRPQSWRYATLHELICTMWEEHTYVYGVQGFSKDKLLRYNNWVAGGGEGAILKDSNAEYGKGWVKVKKSVTLDVVITGFTEANEGVTGKYKGQIGAALISVYDQNKLVEVGQVSGMTDEIRLDMSSQPKNYIGKVVEVQAQEMAKDRLRHPRFKRMRPETAAKHATMRKLLIDLSSMAVKKEKMP